MPGPKRKLKSSPLYLPSEEWRQVDEMLDFHNEAFARNGWAPLSRNEFIRYILISWGQDAYWEQIGGRPPPKDANGKDRDERRLKVERFAALLKKRFGDADEDE